MGELGRAEEALERCLAPAAETGSLRRRPGDLSAWAGEALPRPRPEEAERLGLVARDWLERSGETYMGVQNLIALARCAGARRAGRGGRHMQDACRSHSTEGLARRLRLPLPGARVPRPGPRGRGGGARRVRRPERARGGDVARAEVLLMEGALAAARPDVSGCAHRYERAIALLEDQQLALETADAQGRARRRPDRARRSGAGCNRAQVGA